jgi:hypothetical protein
VQKSLNGKAGKAPDSKTSKQTVVLTTFHLFKRLPAELRSLIRSWPAPAASLPKPGWLCDGNVPTPRAFLHPIPLMPHACHDADGTLCSSSEQFTFVDNRTSRSRERLSFSKKVRYPFVAKWQFRTYQNMFTQLTNTYLDFFYDGFVDRHSSLDLSPHLRHLTTGRH